MGDTMSENSSSNQATSPIFGTLAIYSGALSESKSQASLDRNARALFHDAKLGRVIETKKVLAARENLTEDVGTGRGYPAHETYKGEWLTKCVCVHGGVFHQTHIIHHAKVLIHSF